MQIYHKANVYLTCGSRLLVFDEPDSPEIGLQVPGGTVDPGESYLMAARREFEEETGLQLDRALDHFADQDLPFNQLSKDDPQLASPLPPQSRHLRKHFHSRIARPPAEEWEHFEMTPSNGGAPIRFRLHWIDLFGKTAQDPSAFHASFGEPIAALTGRIRRSTR